MINLLKQKLIIALFPAGLFILSNDDKLILALVIWILIIDTILGSAVALKKKRFCSYKLKNAVHKFLVYSGALATAFLVSKLKVPLLEYFYYYVGAFIVITEALSNFENLALLGFQLPKNLMKRLNMDFKNEDIEKILNKK